MLNEFERRLLNEVQKDLPLVQKPFLEIAKHFSVKEEDIIFTLKNLQERGYIRRIGVFFNSEKMGFKGMLIAVKVKKEALQEVVSYINKSELVTHNYEREGEYNLWFTLQSRTENDREAFLLDLKTKKGVLDVLELPSEKKYKIRVELPIEEQLE